MSDEPRTRFSAARRSALCRVGAAGVALFVPACGPSNSPEGPSDRAGDFTAGALRLDLRQRLADSTESFELERIRYEPEWPGCRDRLADGPDWGDYRLSLHGPDRDTALFLQGFDTSLAPHVRSATTQLS